jgi:hypothetical protein
MNTDELVENLARAVRPAPPLPRPGVRACTWFAGAALYLALLAAGMGVVNGYPDGAGAVFWTVQIAAIVTSLLASAAAFSSVVPDIANRSRGLALAAAAVWLAMLTAASTDGGNWSAVSAATHEWWCVGFIVAGGAPLLAVLAWMLRRGAPLEPATTAGFAALSVAALANVGACFSLPHANNAITLAWHGGVIAVCTVLGAASGRLLFRWRLERPPAANAGGEKAI